MEIFKTLGVLFLTFISSIFGLKVNTMSVPAGKITQIPTNPQISATVTPIPTILNLTTPVQKKSIQSPVPTTANVIKDTTPPKAEIISPVTGQILKHVPVKIIANVSDSSGIQRVEFFVGSGDYLKLGEIKQPPYELTWTPDSSFDNGNNIPVYIKAFDLSGNRADAIIYVSIVKD